MTRNIRECEIFGLRYTLGMWTASQKDFTYTYQLHRRTSKHRIMLFANEPRILNSFTDNIMDILNIMSANRIFKEENSETYSISADYSNIIIVWLLCVESDVCASDGQQITREISRVARETYVVRLRNEYQYDSDKIYPTTPGCPIQCVSGSHFVSTQEHPVQQWLQLDRGESLSSRVVWWISCCTLALLVDKLDLQEHWRSI